MRQEYDFSKGERGRFYRPNAKLNLPQPIEKPDWAGSNNPICGFIAEQTRNTLRAYREQPHLITEHANHEHDVAHGGYAHRQLFELVQNSADALANALCGQSILVRLTENHLYCADDGDAISQDGVRALMFSHLSSKRNTSEIGRFGLGFKSVLGVTDAPEFYSRAGSFRFDREYAADCIAKFVPGERYPVLRLPVPIDVRKVAEGDDDLVDLMTWATNIVRLPLKPGAWEDLAQQVRDFPPEFLLFVDHVRHLTLEGEERSRKIVLERFNGKLRLDTGSGSSRWKCFKITHQLSAEAQEDRRSLDDGGEVPVWWAAPLDRLNEPGYFWHFFPTKTASLLAGILNAPWKTNEDRQNLLPGPYNDELIDAAARMVARCLPDLASERDPARHLDALPRRYEAGDTEHSNRLRDRLYEELRGRPVVPDQVGTLRRIRDVSYGPSALTQDLSGAESLQEWAEASQRPTDWLHHSGLRTNRIARVNRLFSPERRSLTQAPRSSIGEWLNALVDGSVGAEAIEASMTALQVAASIPQELRQGAYLGDILRTQSGDWCSPDPDGVFLSSFEDDQDVDDLLVHARLVSDADTLAALTELGIKYVSAESHFQSLVRRLFRWNGASGGTGWTEFWVTSRDLGTDTAYAMIKARWDSAWRIQVWTRSGHWQGLYSALLPGEIVSSAGARDSDVTVDTDFHRADLKLLERLGVTDGPRPNRQLSGDPAFEWFVYTCRRKFTARDLPKKPHWRRLQFDSTVGSGPMQVLTQLSDEGRARYTDALLSLETTYGGWTLRHETQRIYPELPCPNPAVALLREHGRIRCAGEIVPLADALGPHPANPAALSVLLSHPMASRIRKDFDLAEPAVEPVGEEDAVPLTDVWPGLAPHLSAHSMTWSLIRCLELVADGASGPECVLVDSKVYLVRTDDEDRELRLVTQRLGLDLSDTQLEHILRYAAPEEVERQHAAIRRLASDAERLAQAVGADALRSGLPTSLLQVLEVDRTPMTGMDLAEIAIATYHTSALKEYKWALDHLDPPKRWAGSQRAVDFVRSLGFSAEWAGQRSSRRPPFLDVEGPHSLPELHGYQRTIVDRVRDMLCNGFAGNGGRRGMISLPTGSGKTRVAVQAIVEAIRDGFNGGVLWVADRDELCEQAVEAWGQVWSSVGAEGKRLRISRMWAGQPRPLPGNDLHVIVATIQTLNAKLSKQPGEYSFLSDFTLVVFDEAHRSIAPTFTSVMEEIGLTRWQRSEEPFLIGLTATPYRGHDERETARLVRRYGANRLDAGALASDEPGEVVRELQELRVLARADHEIIEGGDFSLSREELKILQAMRFPAWLPRSMEDRIARDVDRTKRIVHAYERLVGNVSPEWPTLVFATSVEHALTVAALLNSQGVRSRVVSGATESSVRRRIVEEYRAGEIRVLVNYGVFREGFDAPKTRVIIVARPVYSPNLYFQMIGRGLRGPRNGGNDRCLIVNVRDNIENFNRELAFSGLDWLWG